MKSKEECIKIASKVVSRILSTLKRDTKEGCTGKDLDYIASKIMEEEGVKSSCLNYNNFPSYICVSINHQLTHGIPSDKRINNGDIVSVDVCCNYEGYHADAATTFLVGEIKDDSKSYKVKNLLKTTKDSLYYAIKNIIPGKTTNQDIGEMIHKYVSSRGYHVIEEYGGHGIGEKLHEDPFIPNKRNKLSSPFTIEKGMFICIEPLVQLKDNKIIVLEDG
jgi:methionyl aminopeptidase